MLVSLYYSTHDLDLLVSLGLLPNAINSFSREPNLSAKCIPKFVVSVSFCAMADVAGTGVSFNDIPDV